MVDELEVVDDELELLEEILVDDELELIVLIEYDAEVELDDDELRVSDSLEDDDDWLVDELL